MQKFLTVEESTGTLIFPTYVRCNCCIKCAQFGPDIITKIEGVVFLWNALYMCIWGLVLTSRSWLVLTHPLLSDLCWLGVHQLVLLSYISLICWFLQHEPRQYRYLDICTVEVVRSLLCHSTAASVPLLIALLQCYMFHNSVIFNSCRNTFRKALKTWNITPLVTACRKCQVKQGKENVVLFAVENCWPS